MKQYFNTKIAVLARIVGIAVLACAGCCLLPGGVLFGMIAATGLTLYWPWIGLLLLLPGIALLVWRRLKSKQDPACHVNGPCAPKR